MYSDDGALTHFARMAKVYRAWEPYRRRLVDEAADKGYPMVRHLFPHYPEDTTARRLRYEEFLVGSELLGEGAHGQAGGVPPDGLGGGRVLPGGV